MSATTYRKLASFFAPFNDAINVLTGCNLTHWNNKQLVFDSLSIQPSPQDFLSYINATTVSPTEWYELESGKDEDASKGKKGWRAQLVSALLPKKTSADSGYNTTVGMLTMF
jgi:hypothetical protein